LLTSVSSTAVVPTKVLNLFKRAKEGNTETDETFDATVDWFNLFKYRFQLHNITITGEAAGQCK
jgi:thiamine biosynthesis lipoprotein ApbE